MVPPAARSLETLRRGHPATEAFERLAAPLRSRQGIRVGALGVTGAGKTTTIAAFAAYLQAQGLIDLVVIHDVKEPRQQYPGPVVHEADEIKRAPPESYPATRVLRRRDVDHVPDVEAAARFALEASYNGIATLLLVDEMSRAVSPEGRAFTSPSVRRLFSEGRALGASIVWSSQLPQRVPIDGYDQSQILLHRLGTKALGYLVDQKAIDTRTGELVQQLGVGQFVISSSDEDFDGQVYDVPAPAPPVGA